MPWWGGLMIAFAVLFLFGTIVWTIVFRNKVISLRESIKNAMSMVRIAKAKYLQVLRKVDTAQRGATNAQGDAYRNANHTSNGRLIGGAIGGINSNFEEAGSLVVSLANEYQSAQKNLNELVNKYNVYISSFPRVILSKAFKYKKANYVDAANLMASTRLSGFDEKDI